MQHESSSWREHAAYNSGVMAVVGSVGALIIALFNTGTGDTVRLFATDAGQPSLAAVLVLVSTVMGAVVTSYSYRGLFLARKEAQGVIRLAEEKRGRSVLLRFFASLGIGILNVFSVALIFYLISGSMADVVVNRAFAIVVAVVLGALLSYVTAYWVITVRPRQLFRLALALLVISLIMGMVSLANPSWWRTSLGYFGYPTYADLLFAFGLLIACLVVLAVAMDIMSDLRVIVDIGGLPAATFDRLKFGLYGVSLGVAGIGLFPGYVDPNAETLFAFSVLFMAALVMVGMFTSPWLMPEYPRMFRWVSLIAGGAVVGFTLAWLPFGQISFVALAVLMTAVSIAWVMIYQMYTTGFVLRQRGALRSAAAQIKAARAEAAHTPAR